jgi:hypothetical protein
MSDMSDRPTIVRVLKGRTGGTYSIKQQIKLDYIAETKDDRSKQGESKDPD